MTTISQARDHLLWTIGWEIKQLTESQQKCFEAMGSRNWVRRFLASYRLRRLLPKLVWWNHIKLAIESDDPARALPVLEWLISHYRPIKLALMFPTSHLGFQMLALASVSAAIDQANMLCDDCRRRAA